MSPISMLSQLVIIVTFFSEVVKFETNSTLELKTGHVLLHLLCRHKHNIAIIPEPVPNSLSSTVIRKQAAQGRTIRYLVPDGVVEYLATHPEVYASKL
jgi:nicotinic acid mononucleotide adenylyltransferase